MVNSIRLAWVATVVSLVILISAASAHAAIPTTVNYQGYLTDTNGVPLSALLSLEFRLYKQLEGGDPEWTESHSVGVNNGFFNVELGSDASFPEAIFEEPVFLGITVVGDSEMTPRLRFSSVPTAFYSEDLVACGLGQTNCNGFCANLTSDLMNCGVCGTQCDAGGGETCFESSCTVDVDADLDGFTVLVGQDCNDSDKDIFPGATEICNGIDDDCNQVEDDSIAPVPCPLQDGVCSGSTATCNGAAGFGVCGATEYGVNFEQVETTCDSLDNDCNGITDDGFNLQGDLQNCGACGNVCPGVPTQCQTPTCTAGVCGFLNEAESTSCDGVQPECHEPHSCDGEGSCVDRGFKPSGTLCTGGVCDSAGLCITS